jgi:hypothetical protein
MSSRAGPDFGEAAMNFALAVRTPRIMASC